MNYDFEISSVNLFAVILEKFFVCLFQLCLFNEATVPGYETICVLFCVHIYSFAALISQTPPPKFSDTVITNHHSDTTFFQLRAHWCGNPGLLDRENCSDMCRQWKSNPRLPM